MGKKNKKKNKQSSGGSVASSAGSTEALPSSQALPELLPSPSTPKNGLSTLQVKLQHASVTIDGDRVVLDLNGDDSEEKLKKVVGLPDFFTTPPSELSLSYNLLGGSIADCIVGGGVRSYWGALVMLNVAENGLTSLEGIEAMHALERLNASGNKVQDSSPLRPLKLLKSVRLSRNDIKDLESAVSFVDSKNLSDLTLSGNPCASLSQYRSFAVFTLTSVEVLDGVQVSADERTEAEKRWEKSANREILANLEEKVSAGTDEIDDEVSKREFVQFELKAHEHAKELKRESRREAGKETAGANDEAGMDLKSMSVTEVIEKTAEKVALGDNDGGNDGDNDGDNDNDNNGDNDNGGNGNGNGNEASQERVQSPSSTKWKTISPRKGASPPPPLPSPLVSENNVAGSIQLVAKRLASPTLDNNERSDATIESGVSIVERIKEESMSLPSPAPSPAPVLLPQSQPAAPSPSHASEIANRTHFLEDEDDDENDLQNSQSQSRSLFQEYADNDVNTSTSSITGALLAAHRKNRFLEEELKRERQERLEIKGTVKALQNAVDDIRHTGDGGEEAEEKADEWQEKIDTSQISISLLESRAQDAEETASVLHKQLVDATAELANQKEMAGEERKLLMKDIAVLTSSRKVINNASTTLYTNSAVRNLSDASSSDAPAPAAPLFTTSSQKETFAAKVAIKLHEALASTQVVTPSDVTAKACVDAALQCIEGIAGFSIAFSTNEEKVKQTRERLESLNKRLEEESALLKRTMGDVEKYENLKTELTTDYNSLVHQLRTEKERLERIKSRRDEEEAEANHSLEKCKREIELTLKRSDAEKERLAILKSEVDGEQVHLKELRQVAEAEFNALQKNVEALAAKAGDVKEDINEKRLVAERLKDKINHLKSVQYEQQKGFDDSTARGEKELERLRHETRRVEDSLSDLREEVSSRRLREEEKLEGLRSQCDKLAAKNLSAREDYALEKRGQEEKRRRWSQEIDELKGVVNERTLKLGDIRREIEDGGLKMERLRKNINDSERNLSEVNSKVEFTTEELVELGRKKNAVQDELSSNIVSMENAIHQGRLVSEKLKQDSERLKKLEDEQDEKSREVELLARKSETMTFDVEQKTLEFKALEAETFRKREEVEALNKQISALESSREEMRFVGAEKERLESERVSVEGIVLAEMEKHSVLEKRSMLLKQEVQSLEVTKEQKLLEFNKLEGDTKALAAESNGLQEGIVSRKGLQESLSETIKTYTEKAAVLEAKTRTLALKAQEADEALKVKDNELRALEHMVIAAQGKREVIQRDHHKLERDLKEARSIENELSMLRRSRDMASSEAMRAEEQSVYARERLRELEGRVLRERGVVAAEANVGGGMGGGGRGGGGNSLRFLKAQLDQSSSSAE
ncbi:hypothetical protein TrRE_jg11642 [Triparma retinervis]|uniref:Uncharacterized protein n=1 Tax=Triparma retinervis TaxID=2557542 RepID=A0A9W7A4L7_9STRA|nr:hypothetical protein TrRE_jg11642 [Triparma retinervis]